MQRYLRVPPKPDCAAPIAKNRYRTRVHIVELITVLMMLFAPVTSSFGLFMLPPRKTVRKVSFRLAVLKALCCAALRSVP